MNSTKYWNPGRTVARTFVIIILAATFFLVPGATCAADGTTVNTADAIVTEEFTIADAAAINAATAPSGADASTRTVMRTALVGITATLDCDHADIFGLISGALGILTLCIREDATGSGVIRGPEQMPLAVNESTLTQIPVSVSQAIGAPAAAYLLGQSGDNQVTVL